MSYAAVGAISQSEWDANTSLYGMPIWRGGYWFWDGAGIIHHLVCTPFGDRAKACVKWAMNDLLPSAKVPPFLEDQSIYSPLSAMEINAVIVAIINPVLLAEGKSSIGASGQLTGKVRYGAELVRSKRTQMPYNLARDIARIIVYAEYNNIEALDPSSADLIPVPSIDELKNTFLTTTTDTDTDTAVPFWKSSWVLGGVLVAFLVVVAKQRRQKR